MSLNRLVLVLNASYEAIRICPARRALTLVHKGAAVVQEVSSYVIRTPQVTVPVPSVIRLVRYRKVPRQKRVASRKNIFLRDGYTCQYCVKKLSPPELTIDHVVPKSKGGGNEWENAVACCKPCNSKKGDRTPQEAGMALYKVPRSIGVHAKHRLMAGNDNAIWDRYLFV